MAKNQTSSIDDQIKELLANAPTATTSTSIPPIGGMPASFVAHRQEAANWVQLHPPMVDHAVPVQYFEGDEWQPANSSPQDIARVQQQMIEAGLIPKGTAYHPGVWDDTTRSAFKGVLAYANATGFNADMALKTLATSPATKAPAPAYLQPDIASVAQDVKATVQKKLGRDATPDEVRHLSDVMLGFDRKAYNVQIAADAAQPGSTVGNIDPTAEFSQYLEQQYRPEIDRTKAVADLSQNRENLMGNILTLDKAIKG